MKLDVMQISTDTNCVNENRQFKIKASPVAFEILSSKLYSNPLKAMVRELLTNAYDSQMKNGNADKLIDVTVPNWKEKNFIVRDYGTGLSKEEIFEIYTTFFESTKQESNDFTGCFGLGSKTPFAFTNAFTVTSFHNGIKTVYAAVKKDGLPHIYEISSEKSSEHSGLMVCVPCNDNIADNEKFANAIRSYTKFIPELKLNCNIEVKPRTPIMEIDNVRFYTPERGGEAGGYIKHGLNCFKIGDFIFNTVMDRFPKEEIGSCIHQHLCIVFDVPIGTISIVPSREHMSETEENKREIVAQCVSGITKLSKAIDNDTEFKLLNKCSYLSDAYVKKLNDRVFNKKTVFRYVGNKFLKIWDVFNGMLNVVGETSSTATKVDTIKKNGKITFVYGFDTNSKSQILKLRKYLSVNNYDPDSFMLVNLRSKYTVNIITDPVDRNNAKREKAKAGKLLKDLIKGLKEVPFFGTTVNVIGAKELNKEFKEKRTSKVYEETGRIRFQSAWLDYRNDENRYVSITRHYAPESAHNIKDMFSESNTMICQTPTEDADYLAEELATLMNINDFSGNMFMRDYMCRILDCKKPGTMNILFMARKRMDMFGEYPQINIYDLLRYGATHEWKVMEESHVKYVNDEIVDGFLDCLDRRKTYLIRRSTAYRIGKTMNRFMERCNFLNVGGMSGYINVLKRCTNRFLSPENVNKKFIQCLCFPRIDCAGFQSYNRIMDEVVRNGHGGFGSRYRNNTKRLVNELLNISWRKNVLL